MKSLEPRIPRRPLLWPDSVLDISDLMIDTDFEVYIVGGAVRDAYLHRSVKDLDLITPSDARKLGRWIANRAGGAFYILDDSRDVCRALIETHDGPFVVDVARFRGPGLLDDLLDRDFTFNAMAVDLRNDMKRLIDPLDGEQDLTARIIRRCSEQSLINDPVRALRAVRQSVQFDARIEPQTLADIRGVTARIVETSPERVRDELFKLIDGKAPSRSLRIVDALGLLHHVLPETIHLQAKAFEGASGDDNAWSHSLLVVEKLRGILDTIGPARTEQTAAVFTLGMVVMSLDVFRGQLKSHISHQWPEGRSHEAILIFAAVLHEIGTEVDERIALMAQRANQLRLSNGEKHRLAGMLRALSLIEQVDENDVLSLHRFWRRFELAGVDACLLALAEMLGTYGIALQQDAWLQYLERMQVLLDAYFSRYETVVAPPAIIDGKELMKLLDLRSGPIVGELLDVIREAQVEGRATTRDHALRIARDHLHSEARH